MTGNVMLCTLDLTQDEKDLIAAVREGAKLERVTPSRGTFFDREMKPEWLEMPFSTENAGECIKSASCCGLTCGVLGWDVTLTRLEGWRCQGNVAFEVKEFTKAKCPTLLCHFFDGFMGGWDASSFQNDDYTYFHDPDAGKISQQYYRGYEIGDRLARELVDRGPATV